MANSNVQENKLVKEVLGMVGETVQTVWGPSEVSSVEKDENGEWLVHLLEFGEEPFCVKLSDWSESLM